MLIGFKWILKNQLAGSGRPGLYHEMDDDIRFMKNNGITTVVNLTETGLDEEVASNGFDVVHFPIPDMGIPMPRPTRQLCLNLKSRMEDGETVLVHCKAGLGRTGTILACLLTEHGRTATEAIKEVRSSINLAIQNRLQEKFISDYEKHKLDEVS